MKVFQTVAAAASMFLAVADAGSASASTFDVTINTSTISGTSAEVALDLIGSGSLANTIAISSFSIGNGSWNNPTTTGNVVGSLPSNVVLSDLGSFFNELLVNVTLGDSLSFRFASSNNFPGSIPTGFSAFLLDPVQQLPLFTTTDPTGSNALFLLSIDGIASNGVLDTYSATNGDVALSISTAVPEPSTWVMMFLGFIGLGISAFRRTKNSIATLAAA